MKLARIAPIAVMVLLLAGEAGAQTYDPATGASPLTLLAAPADGVAYHEARVRARELFGAQKFAEAQPLLERLARDYPRDADNWMLLGHNLRRLNRFDAAAAAYEKAGPLVGWDIQFWNGYRIASARLAAGDRRGALDALRRMIHERHGFWRSTLYDDPAYAALKDDPEFLELVGRPNTAAWTRDQGWVRDIDYLHDEVKRVNPDYRDAPFPPELVRRYEQLKRDVPRLSDEEIFVGMGRMLSVLRQGHTVLWDPPRNRHLPVRLYAFPEGVFVIEADDAYRGLVGARVVRFGAVPAEEMLRRLSEALSTDGDMEYLWNTSFLMETSWLKGLGGTASADSVRLALQLPGGAARTVTLATRDSARPGRQDRLVPPPGDRKPMFLRNLSQTFWHAALPEHDAMYLQVNNLKDSPDETLAAYGRRLWEVLDTTSAPNLIVDLRHNNGGTTQLYPELLRTLVAYSRVPGRQVYVMIGRRTYSAAGNFVTDLERLTDPVFVGEASSECCNLYGDPVTVRLPYSHTSGELTAVRWQLSAPGDRRREISPDVPVQLTARAYFAGEDPALDAVYRMIAARPAAAPRTAGR